MARPVTVEIFSRNLQPKSSSEIFIRAVLAIVEPIKLVGPNTAVFGTRTLTLEPHTACRKGGWGLEYKIKWN